MTTAVFEAAGIEGLAAAAGELAERLRRGTVAVIGPGDGRAGSGTIWSSDGLIVTNNHVAPGGDARVLTWDDRLLPAEVLTRDPEQDLAALRVPAADLPALEPADSDSVRAGQLVFAAGNPNGERGVVTAGIIVSSGSVTSDNEAPLEGGIRADIRLLPGNSGGPLADAQGRVVGINAMVAGGMALAVPSNAVVRFLAGERAEAGFLGIEGRGVPLPVAVAERLPGDGAGLLLTGVVAGSPAERAGLLPGDLVLAADHRQGLAAIARRLRRLRPGRPVELLVLRAGGILELEAVPAAGR